MGYPEVASIATFSLGVPMAIEPSFMLESGMDKLLPEAEDITRQKLAVLDTIEAQMVGDLELLAVERVEEITIRKDEHHALLEQYRYWQASLANDFRVIVNPYDFRGAMGGVNVRVQH
jgi:hypothetical protein